MDFQLLLILSLALIANVGTSSAEIASLGNSCPTADGNGVMTLLVPGDSPKGQINLMLIKYDSKRKLPISSTIWQDGLNSLKAVTRASSAEPFGPVGVNCSSLGVPTSQINCTGGISMTDAQKVKASPRYTWDRGHLTPANPMRFSNDALNKTFYCINIAPQDSWTNQIPWMTLEVKTENKLKETSGFVMTGLCSADNVVDGPTTYKGYTIPKCYWKMACYKDNRTKETKVVGFIGENTIVNFNDRVAQSAKNETTLTPRPQSEILPLLTRPELISEGWTQAASNLIQGRGVAEGDVPTAQDCIAASTISTDTFNEWKQYIRS